MEEQAPYSAAPSGRDLRRLAAPAAAWLIALGFIVKKNIVLEEYQEAEWTAPNGSFFRLSLMIDAVAAQCDLFVRLDSGHSRMVLLGHSFRRLRELRTLLLGCHEFTQARQRPPTAPEATEEPPVPDSEPPPAGGSPLG